MPDARNLAFLNLQVKKVKRLIYHSNFIAKNRLAEKLQESHWAQGATLIFIGAL